VTSPSSQIKLKFFQVRVMTWSSRVRIESQELSSRFEYLVCNLESIRSHTKFHGFSTTCFCCEIVPDKLENGAQCCFNKFDYMLFISKFSQLGFYLSLSFSVVSKSLAQPCCKCCSLSFSTVVNV